MLLNVGSEVIILTLTKMVMTSQPSVSDAPAVVFCESKPLCVSTTSSRSLNGAKALLCLVPLATLATINAEMEKQQTLRSFLLMVLAAGGS